MQQQFPLMQALQVLLGARGACICGVLAGLSSCVSPVRCELGRWLRICLCNRSTGCLRLWFLLLTLELLVCCFLGFLGVGARDLLAPIVSSAHASRDVGTGGSLSLCAFLLSFQLNIAEHEVLEDV